jgi:hypothetical protein
MNNRQLFCSFLVCFFVAGLAFAALPSTMAADAIMFGYPYYSTQAGGSGAKYDAHGSLFSLNGDADINSISCLMNGGFSPTEPNDRYIYRFAIYSDSNGKVGTLISQTETGTFIGKPGGSNDVWNTASFPQTVHLTAGKYWLFTVDNASGYIVNHDEYPAANYTMVTSVLGGMNFPATLGSPVYSPDFVLCIYASGIGASSVPDPLVNGQKVSRLFVGCTLDYTSDMNKILITGNLTANYAAIPSAPVLLSYADNPNATWHEIGTVTTASDGSFTGAWLPTRTGSYVINATYVGDSNYTAQTTLANVILPTYSTVFSVDSNSTVSQLGFNSQTSQLSFSVAGASGTTGYAVIYAPKGVVDDASKIQASIDGAPANFTVTSAGDAWVLNFIYHHSVHDVVFSLNNPAVATVSPAPSADTSGTPKATPIPELTLSIALAALAVLLVGALVIKRQQH